MTSEERPVVDLDDDDDEPATGGWIVPRRWTVDGEVWVILGFTLAVLALTTLTPVSETYDYLYFYGKRDPTAHAWTVAAVHVLFSLVGGGLCWWQRAGERLGRLATAGVMVGLLGLVLNGIALVTLLAAADPYARFAGG